MNKNTGNFTCCQCGTQWSPLIRPGGRMPRGYSICPHCGTDQKRNLKTNSKRRNG